MLLMEYDELLAHLAEILNNQKRPYYVTGGFAVSVWGRPRATYDIDVVISIHEEDVSVLATALRGLDGTTYVDEEMMRSEIRRNGEFNVIHLDSALKIDFWVLKDSPTDLLRLKRRVPKTIRGIPVYFISPEDLILSKLQWYEQSKSSRHLQDVAFVLKISDALLDHTYLAHMAKQMGVAEILQMTVERKAPW